MAIRILLITPQFYGIEKKIKSVLEESHYEVTWVENKPHPFDFHGTRSKFKLLRRVYFFLVSPYNRYVRTELKKMTDLKFDILFSINAHIICPHLFKKLKGINPKLFSVLFLWDSFMMFNWTNELKLFNRVYTFDPDDAIKYKITYKPNFYVSYSNNTCHKNEYDIFFVGKFNPERLVTIDKIISLKEEHGIKFFVKLWPAYKIFFHNYFLYRMFNILSFNNIWLRNYQLNFEAVEGILKRDYLIMKSLDYNETQNHLLSSNVILDLPIPGQKGYTHRVIEALANGKKIITTNSNIKKEFFFNPEQIHIIENQNPVFDDFWIKEKSEFRIDNYFLSLELSEWLKAIVDVGIV